MQFSRTRQPRYCPLADFTMEREITSHGGNSQQSFATLLLKPNGQIKTWVRPTESHPIQQSPSMIVQWGSPAEPSGTRHSCQIHEEGPPVDPHLSTSKNPRATSFIHARSSSPHTAGRLPKSRASSHLRPRRARGSPRATSLGDKRGHRRTGRVAASGHLLFLLRASPSATPSATHLSIQSTAAAEHRRAAAPWCPAAAPRPRHGGNIPRRSFTREGEQAPPPAATARLCPAAPSGGGGRRGRR
jgi:hypothetical protein